MKTMPVSKLAAAVLAAIALVGCASGPRHQHYGRAPQQPAYAGSVQYGQVANVEQVRLSAQPSGLGAVIGGVAGAVVGNQIGKGGGRDAMTVIGAVGGAVAGNQIEGNRRGGPDVYRITVRLNDGNVRAFDYEQLGDLRIGDRVRVEDNRIFRY